MSYDPLDLVLSKLQRVRKSGGGYVARCPAHDDHKPSLSIKAGEKGQVIFNCFDGCTAEAIASALGLTMSELYPDHGQPKERRQKPTGPRQLVAVYDYIDAAGERVYQNLRYSPKDFKARRPDGKGGWIWTLNEIERVPFNLPGLLQRKPGEPIFLTEGEKDAQALIDLGLLASCHKALGNEGWRSEWNQYLRGCPVFVMRDNDHAGIEYAEKGAQTLHAGGIEIAIVALPGLQLGGDVSDWLAQGGTADDLVELAAAEESWRPESESPPASTIPLFPPFPTDTLPPALRALCEEASASFGYPPDYVALPALAMIGTLAGGSIELLVKPGWFERAVGWFVQIGEPGSAKSPAQDLAIAPLQGMQARAYAHYMEMLDRWEDLPKKDREGEPPELELLYTTDLTVEAVARHHRHSLLVAPDELTSWLAGFNRYRGAGASERGQWLSGWALTSMVVARASKGATIVTRPTVNITGGIQPDRLRMLLQDAKGDSMNDGFLDRLLPCWPTSTLGDWTEAEVHPLTLSSWERLADDIRRNQVRGENANPHVVKLGENAKRAWGKWYNANQRSTQDATGMGRGWSAKAPRHLLRLSLALHVATHPKSVTEPMSLETLEAGIELVDWFRGQHGHMLSALGAGEASRDAGVGTRIERVLNTYHNEWVDRSTLYRKLRNVKSDVFDAAVTALEEDGKIERRQVQTGTKPKEEFRARKFSLSHFSQNPPPRTSGSWNCACGASLSALVYPDGCPDCGARRPEAA